MSEPRKEDIAENCIELLLTETMVLNDALEVLGLQVAARMATPPGTIRAKWGEVNGVLVPQFTVVTEHGRIPPPEVYGRCMDLYAAMGAKIRAALAGLGERRGEEATITFH